MFAPHCSTCRRRVLLGPRRIVRFAWSGEVRIVVLRCFCGALVRGDQERSGGGADANLSCPLAESG